MDRLRSALRGEDLPAVVVDLEAFDRNLDRHENILRGTGLTLRLATKSIRVPALLRRVLERGFARGLMCYSVREAEWLAERGFDDLFVAYPPWSERDLERLAALTAKGTAICAAADSLEALARFDAVGARRGVVLRAVLCVDMSLRALGGRFHLGVRRSPIHTVEEVVIVAEGTRDLPHVVLHGVMGYEAQVAGLGDDSAFDRRLVRLGKRAFRRVSMSELGRRRATMVSELRTRGFELAFVNGGGTGSLELTLPSTGVTEVSAGSGLFKPTLFDGYASPFVRALEPSCFFALEVRRRAAADVVTCFGGGYVASGALGPDKLPLPVYPEGLQLLSAEGPGEVQTPLSGRGARALAPGDSVLFRYAKAGELMERFHEALLSRDGAVVQRAPTYRGAGFAFG